MTLLDAIAHMSAAERAALAPTGRELLDGPDDWNGLCSSSAPAAEPRWLEDAHAANAALTTVPTPNPSGANAARSSNATACAHGAAQHKT